MAEKVMTMCPFCRRECYLEGDSIYCTHCDAEYAIEKKGPILKQDGAITGMKEDIEKIKAKIGLVEGGNPEDLKPLEPEVDLDPPEEDKDPGYWAGI